MYIRTKAVEKDGAKFIIAPLSVGQVETWQEAWEEHRKNKANDGADIVRMTIEYIVCPGLNNFLIAQAEEANGTGAPPKLWTPEAVREKLDMDLVTFLHNQILEFNGVPIEKRVASATPGTAQGETNAASTSQPSDAALSPPPAGPLNT